MRSRARAIAATTAVVLSVASGTATRGDDAGPDVSCGWRKLDRRCVVHGASLTLRARGTLDVACDGPSPVRRIVVALYASSDGVVPQGAAPIATKRVRPRAGRTVRVSFDAKLPLGAAGRRVIARVDDAGEIAETDETNNLAVGGPFSTGEEFAPLEAGNAWRYAGTRTEGGSDLPAYANAVTVLGPHLVDGGVVAQAVSSSHSRGAADATVEYLKLDDRGVVDWGNDDAGDTITAQIAPFLAMPFPFASPYELTTVSRRGLSLGEDVDGDGRIERLNASQRVRFVGFEDVDVPVGRFEGCVHLRTRASATVVLSRSGVPVRVVGTQHQWFAPGIGPVRIVEDYVGPGVRDHSEETLTGAATPAAGCGVVDGLEIASVAAPSYGETASMSALATDGSVALIATVRGSGGPPGLIGVIVSPTGREVLEFKIADIPLDLTPPAMSAAFGAGVFVVACGTPGEPVRLRAVTTDGALSWGGAALDLPFTTVAPDAVRVVFDGSGFLVFAQGPELPSLERAVSVARVGADGRLLGTTRLSGDTYFTLGRIDAAWDGSSALCVWSGIGECFAMRVSGTGEPLDATPTRFAATGGFTTGLSLVASPAGGWFVVWTRDGHVVRCLFSPDGAPSTPDGVAIGSQSTIEGEPQAALDGAEYLVVFESPDGWALRAVRVSLAGDVVPESAGGFGPTFHAPDADHGITAPAVATFADRALVVWHRWSRSDADRPMVVGALVFPRRGDLRSTKAAGR